MTRSLRAAFAGLAVAAGAVTVGYLVVAMSGATVAAGMLPWVVGRGLGLAAYAALVALTATGLWLRHPWRLRLGRRSPAPSTLLWLHAGLAAAALLLVIGHVVALALDSFAGVGWLGAFVPGLSSYRPFAVSLGITGLYVGLLAAGAVLLAGRLLGRHWLPVHRLASGAFVLVWLHGVLAGSDTAVLTPVYVVTGAVVLALAMTRRLVPAPTAMAESGPSR